MAEARIDPEQLRQAVDASVKRALDRDQYGIKGPILIGIIAWPNDTNTIDIKEIQAIQVDANS